MATTRAASFVVTHTVWNDVLSRLTDDGVTFSGNFNGGTLAGSTLSLSSTATLSGVVTVNAANSRGVVISRSTAADSGLQISNSLKTYGIAVDTGGALRIQDDSDASPRIELSGNDVNIVGTNLGLGNITQAQLADGSASTPSLTFSSDANTGLYRSGADAVAVAAGGNQVLNAAYTTGTVIRVVGGNGEMTPATDGAIVLGAGGASPLRWGCLYVVPIAEASQPGATNNNGYISIDTTNDRLVFYSNGARRYITASGTF